jgi:hypothetical protein
MTKMTFKFVQGGLQAAGFGGGKHNENRNFQDIISVFLLLITRAVVT